MKKLRRVALVAAGKITDLPLARTPGFIDRLGPVKAPSLRVASRIANTLRAGHPVSGYGDFENIAIVVISLPDAIVLQEVAAMTAVKARWSGTTFILCSHDLGCDALTPLASAGALTASLSLIPGFERNWFLLEADKPVERQVRPLLPRRARVTTIA